MAKKKSAPARKSGASASGVRIGIIGGSGLYNMPGLEKPREVRLKTPFGDPSDALVVGTLEGKNVAFLSRHARGHRFTPTEINYRANIHAMKQMGVERIISVSAVGSLQEDLKPLDFLIPDQFFDRTRHRISTFFGDGVVAHVGFDKPVCPQLAGVLGAACDAAKVRTHKEGTYICMEGPQFSTLAESHVYRQLRFHVIGMTNLTEAKLAREAEICYSTVAMITDYDCWHPDHDHVTVDSVVRVLMQNVETSKALIRAALPAIHAGDFPCGSGCNRALDHAVLTPPDGRDPALVARLDAVAGRVLG